MRLGRNYRVSRMACEAFHGPAPFDAAVAMHIDEDPRNNRYDNLEWATQKKNLNCQGFITYCKNRTGENNPFIKGRMKKESATPPGG